MIKAILIIAMIVFFSSFAYALCPISSLNNCNFNIDKYCGTDRNLNFICQDDFHNLTNIESKPMLRKNNVIIFDLKSLLKTLYDIINYENKETNCRLTSISWEDYRVCMK